jgi:hypothetical protein
MWHQDTLGTPLGSTTHRPHGSPLQGLSARPILVPLDLHTRAVPR